MVSSVSNASLYQIIAYPPPPPPSIQTFKTSNRLSTVDTDSKKILKLIQGLKYNKAHRHELCYA